MVTEDTTLRSFKIFKFGRFRDPFASRLGGFAGNLTTMKAGVRGYSGCKVINDGSRCAE